MARGLFKADVVSLTGLEEDLDIFMYFAVALLAYLRLHV